MSYSRGVPNAVLRSLFKLLVFLVVPTTFIYYEWSGFAGSLNLVYECRIFTFSSTTVFGGILPYLSPEFNWAFDGMTASAILVAIPGLFFNYRVLRAKEGQSLRKLAAGTILATLLLDVTVPIFLMPTIVLADMRYFYFYPTNTPWIFVLFIFFPTILRQATQLDVDSGRLPSRRRRILPSRNWMLTFLLGSLVTLASPAAITYTYSGMAETVFMAGLILPVGLANGTWELFLADLLVQFIYYGAPYPLDLAFLFIFTLEYYFVFETLRFLRGQVSKTRTCGLALLSWMAAYAGLLIVYRLTSTAEMPFYYTFLPLPVVPLVGIVLLIRLQPIPIKDRATLEEVEEEAPKGEIIPEVDERASEVIVPYHYILRSKVRESRLNVFKRES